MRRLAVAVDTESIARAREHQQQVRAQAGISAPFEVGPLALVTAAEQASKPRIVLAPCLYTGCWYTAGGQSDAEAIGKLEKHLERKHGVRAPKEVA